MISQSEIQTVLQIALSGGGDFAELFFEDRNDNTLKDDGGKIHGLTSLHIHGVGLHVLQGTNSVYVYANDSSYPSLKDLAYTAAELTTSAGKNGKQKKIVLTRAHAVPINPVEIYPGSVDICQKKRILREMRQSAMAAGPVVGSLNVEYFDNVQNVAIANSEGLYVEDTRVFTRVRLRGTVEYQGKSRYSFYDLVKPCGFETFRDNDCNAFAKESICGLERSLKARKVEPCVVPVIFEGGDCGVFWHESCGHNLEATAAQNGCFAGKDGEMIASEKVTLIDDGSIPGLCGSEAIDDEGHPTKKNILIDKGRLVGRLCDRLGGRELNCSSTGSGRRQSYTYAPCARMHNTYLAAGEDDEDEMIASVDNGLFVTELGGGSSGDNFSIAVVAGYWIRDGKLAEPVGNMTLSGTSAEIIKRVDRVGKKLIYDYGGGFCGAASGLVQTTNFQPRFRVSAMRVGGMGDD